MHCGAHGRVNDHSSYTRWTQCGGAEGAWCGVKGSLFSLTLNLSLQWSLARPMDVAEDVQLETVPDMLMRCVYGVVWALPKKIIF